MFANLETRDGDGVLVALVSGNLDSQSSGHWQEQLLAATTSAGDVLLDLSSVPYVSSAGFRVLLVVYRTLVARGGRVALAGLSDEIRDTMEMTGFLPFFLVGGTVEEALAALRQQGAPHAAAR
jgi:anti-sigma B factor antagonist